MSQKLPLNSLKQKKKNSKFNEKFIESYDEDSDKRRILKVDVEYPKTLQNFHNDLPFLPETMNIEKCYKLVCNLYNKKNYVAHITNLEQALNHGLILKK